MPDSEAPSTPPVAPFDRAFRPGAPFSGAGADVARALFDQSPFSTVLYDTAGRVLAVNAAFERLFGLTIDAIPADYSVLTDAQLERDGHLPAVRRAFDGQVVTLPPVFYDATQLDAGGTRSWTQGHFFPTRDATGAMTGVVLVHVDLTERVEAEEARRLSEERLRVALDVGRLGAWEWDIVAGRVHWSDTLQRIHGLVPGTFGGTFEEYQADIHPDDRERVLVQVARSLEGASHELTYRIVRPDGAVRWLDARGELFRDAAGRPARMIGICTDVTERRLADAEREEARLRLEEQASELETQTEQLQTQAADMEAQQAELEQQTEELQAINEELQATNDALFAAREAAERAEAYTRGILGSIGDPFVVQDHEWRFRYVNDAAAAVLARSGAGNAAALLGGVVWELYPELVGTAFEREMRRARDERVPVTFTEFSPRTGRWSEMHCYPMPGGAVATLWRDVTALKQAEEARDYLAGVSEILARSLDRDETARALAQLLVPRLADWCSIQLVDESGNPDTLQQLAVAHVDPAKVAWAAELEQRYPADPSATTGAHEVVRTGQPIVLADIPDALLVAAARDAEHLRILREIGFASALMVPLAARGHVIGAMTLVSAESGRRYGDAELALALELAARAALAMDNAALYAAALRARTEAETANRAKGQFLATMSHELRTPLNAIQGHVQLMEMGVHGPVTDAQRAALDRVQRAQQHLLGLINDVLLYARVEGGRVEYDLHAVAPAEVVADVLPMIEPQLAAKAIHLDVRVAPDAPAAWADRERLAQILLNLLSNAAKFTNAGGRVTIELPAPADDARDAGWVFLRVSDTGIGIPREKLEAVFEPFVQVRQQYRPAQGGTGLGLAISRDLARGMGGDLRAQSVPGEGSTFTLTLRPADDRRREPGA